MKKKLKEVSVKFNIEDLSLTLETSGSIARITKDNYLWVNMLSHFSENEIYDFAKELVSCRRKLEAVLIIKRRLNTDLMNAKMIMENL